MADLVRVDLEPAVRAAERESSGLGEDRACPAPFCIEQHAVDQGAEEADVRDNEHAGSALAERGRMTRQKTADRVRGIGRVFAQGRAEVEREIDVKGPEVLPKRSSGYGSVG